MPCNSGGRDLLQKLGQVLFEKHYDGKRDIKRLIFEHESKKK